MTEEMMTKAELDDLKAYMGKTVIPCWAWTLLRTALALDARVDAFEEWAREYLASDRWLDRTHTIPGERICGQCRTQLHKGRPHKPTCFVGRLVALMEGNDAGKETA